MNDGIVVLLKHKSELFKSVTGETVLTDVYLGKLFVVFEDLCDYR